jgi:hypothetical protein
MGHSGKLKLLLPTKVPGQLNEALQKAGELIAALVWRRKTFRECYVHFSREFVPTSLRLIVK